MSDGTLDLSKLPKLTKEGRVLLKCWGDSTDLHTKFGYWVEDVASWLDEVFPDTGTSAEWSSLPLSYLVIGNNYHALDERTQPEFCNAVQARLTWLSRLAAKDRASDERKSVLASNRVFIVHGHDNEMKESVARSLAKVGLEPIILHEQPNKGKTIIEKFEDNSDVGFAVVCLSPDDLAYPKSKTPKDKQHRARQNVVLELGYFVGKIGRDRVLALKRGALELPSDIFGVAYTSYDDAGSWQFELTRELKAVGYGIDANRLM